MELNTLNDSLPLQAEEMRNLGPFWAQAPQNCPNVQNTVKQVKLKPQMAFKLE